MRTSKSLLLLFVVIIAASCNSNIAVISPTETTTASPTTTASATFTPTPKPTSTPTITPTNTPIPTISKTRINLSSELYLDENSSPENLEALKYPRSNFYNDLSTGFVYHFEKEEWVVGHPWTRVIPLIDVDTTRPVQGELRQYYVQLWKNGKLIYSHPVEYIDYPHRFLRYEDHWIFSFGNIYYNQMWIAQDGVLLNDLYDYDTAFSPFVLDGKPFFFFQRGAEIGISFHNEEIALPYSSIAFGAICCEGGGIGHLNPRASDNKIGFYVQWGDSDYHYVEIGLR